jgi:Ca2+-binding RTX toxin-like protein
LTRPGVDPSSIGRRVDIIFDPSSKDRVARDDYTAADYQFDQAQHEQNYSPVSGVARLLPEMGMVLNELNNAGVTKFVDEGRVIRYDESQRGSTRAPVISDVDKALHGLTGGATMIAHDWGGRLYGSKYNDELLGGNGGDDLEGAYGDDYILGKKGDDSLRGGAGADHLRGGEGNDTLDGGGYGIDSLFGEEGNDSLWCEANGQAYGGVGNDTLDGGASSVLKGEDGDDVLRGDVNCVLDGGAGADRYYVGAGSVVYADSSDTSISLSGSGAFKLYVDGFLITEAMLERSASFPGHAKIGALQIYGFIDPSIPDPLDNIAPQLIGQASAVEAWTMVN